MSRIYFIAVITILVIAACYATFANSSGQKSDTDNPVAAVVTQAELITDTSENAKPEKKADDASESDEPKEEVIDNNTHYCMVKNPLFNEKEPVLFDVSDEEDNSACMVCHADFAFEEISSIHLEAGCTCMTCHGDSDEHRADEYGYIRPDVIWGHGEQAAFCQQCHPKHKNPSKVEEFRKENFSKRLENGRWVNERSTCMDCHGNHAISGTKEGEFK